MPAALDVIAVADSFLREFNCPQAALASLAGIGGAKFSQYLNGVIRIGG